MSQDTGREKDSDTRRGPAGIGDLFERILSEEAAVRGQIDRNARALAQSALSKLDVVSREEFDAQAAVLARTQARVNELEALLKDLGDRLDAAEKGGND